MIFLPIQMGRCPILRGGGVSGTIQAYDPSGLRPPPHLNGEEEEWASEE